MLSDEQGKGVVFKQSAFVVSGSSNVKSATALKISTDTSGSCSAEDVKGLILTASI